MRRPLVAGNWKMHGTRASTAELSQALRGQSRPDVVDVAVFPPFLFINDVGRVLQGSNIALGAQDCAIEAEQGALTGETAASQLQDTGCAYVLVGHSERRWLLNEDPVVVTRKFMAAQKAKLVPVLCVGEAREEREAGRTLEVIYRQLDDVLDSLGVQVFRQAVVAYEPVWAIGTGLTATPEQAQDVHRAIRERFAGLDAEVSRQLRILYGGSVKASNADELFAMPDIDGGLIGGASLKAEEFGAICRAAGN